MSRIDYPAPAQGAEDKALVPATTGDANLGQTAGWSGPTYYGRSQLKAAPFENTVVGGYIVLGGLSGAAAIIAAAADLFGPEEARQLVRRGRFLSLLGPTLGSALLVYDLHTPQRFYNMLRVAKGTSPMSIGTWILMAFTGFSGLTAAGELVSRLWPRLGSRVAKAAQVPAAAAGAGMATYTAALLTATSTPLWAAAPRALAVRFGASSLAAAASALVLRAPPGGFVQRVKAVAAAALAVELLAARSSHRTYERTGVAEALKGPAGQVETFGANALGTMLPLALYTASLALGERTPRKLGTIAALAAIAGSAALRISIMSAGDTSAARPDISFRFSQPANLPK